MSPDVLTVPAAGGVRTKDNKNKSFSVPLAVGRFNWYFRWGTALFKRENWDYAKWQTSDQQQLEYARPHLDPEVTLHYFL